MVLWDSLTSEQKQSVFVETAKRYVLFLKSLKTVYLSIKGQVYNKILNWTPLYTQWNPKYSQLFLHGFTPCTSVRWTLWYNGHLDLVPAYMTVYLHSSLFDSLYVPLKVSMEKNNNHFINKMTYEQVILVTCSYCWSKSGCKENHFYNLPLGQAEAIIY